MGAVLAVVSTAACSDDDGGGPSDGSLGFATFRWQCAGTGDVACVPGRVDDFPRTVAVGASFEAGFVLDERVPNELEPGRIELVGPKAESSGSYGGSYGDSYGDDAHTAVSRTFLALEEGEVSLLAMADDETVADYTELSLIPVSSLAVVQDCRARECEAGVDGDAISAVTAGDRIDLRVEPFGGGALLVGDLDYTWESLAPEVAELEVIDGHVATLQGKQAGTAYLRVWGGGVEDTVAIEVVSSGPHRQRPGGSAGSGSDTGTGTGTDSGTDSGTGTDTEAGTDTDAGSGSGTTGGTQ